MNSVQDIICQFNNGLLNNFKFDGLYKGTSVYNKLVLGVNERRVDFPITINEKDYILKLGRDVNNPCRFGTYIWRKDGEFLVNGFYEILPYRCIPILEALKYAVWHFMVNFYKAIGDEKSIKNIPNENTWNKILEHINSYIFIQRLNQIF